MYCPGKPSPGQPPFGPPQTHGSPFRHGGPRGPIPGQLPPAPFGPFSSSTNSPFLHSRPPHFIRPHCSSFPIDCSTVNAMGGRQQIGPPAEPLQWNPTPVEHHLPDNSDRASEEFLRCIAANKPLPDYLKGNMAYNLAEAFKSANILKEAVRSDPAFQRHATRSKSRSRSRGRSRGKSRAKSRARSKSRPRSRSRGRSKSRARGKSRMRSKSRSRSWSRSRSKKCPPVRSKSRARRSKSRSISGEKNHDKDEKRKRNTHHSCSSIVGSSDMLKGSSLLQGLKLVMNSKELEDRMPTLKDAILTIQASNESKKEQRLPGEPRHQHQDGQEDSRTFENDSMLLPHDRVGSDFSWLQVPSQEDSTVQKANELEDEESFLYGNEDTRQHSSKSSSAAFSQFGEHGKLHEMNSLALSSQQHHQNKSMFSNFGDLLVGKQPLERTSPSTASANLDTIESEKIKNLLKSLGTVDISEIMVKVQGPTEGKQSQPALLGSDPIAVGLGLPALSDPNARQALESLQSLIKATKEKRAKNDASSTSQTSSDKHKVDDDEEIKRQKQARMSKMESLMKELEELMKQDGLSFLTPVIGFYCQKCEEFIGDLNSAEKHAAIHCSDLSSHKVQMDKHAGDSQVHLRYSSSSSNARPHPSDKRAHRDYRHHQWSGDHRIPYQLDWRVQRDHKSHRQENLSLKEELRKERMLITVSREDAPLSDIRVKEEVKKELQAIGSHKAGDPDSKSKCSRNSREKDKEKDESSDSSGDDKRKTQKTKSPKKKKKKKDKKKKEKKDKS